MNYKKTSRTLGIVFILLSIFIGYNALKLISKWGFTFELEEPTIFLPIFSLFLLFIGGIYTFISENKIKKYLKKNIIASTITFSVWIIYILILKIMVSWLNMDPLALAILGAVILVPITILVMIILTIHLISSIFRN